LGDYERIGSYGRICGYGQGGIHGEQTLSKMHLDMGYRIAVLPEPAVQHIGERRALPDVVDEALSPSGLEGGDEFFR
jgi:hypothetical protein